MDKQQAEEIKNKIVSLSKDAGLWVEIQEVHKPDLKDIIITVSMRVDSDIPKQALKIVAGRLVVDKRKWE